MVKICYKNVIFCDFASETLTFENLTFDNNYYSGNNKC